MGKLQLLTIRVVIYYPDNTASKKRWAQCSANTLCWPCFYGAGQFIKEAGSKGGHLLDYWQRNDCRVLWRHIWKQRRRGCSKHIGARASRLEGALKTGLSTCCGSPWCLTSGSRKALKVYSLMKRERQPWLIYISSLAVRYQVGWRFWEVRVESKKTGGSPGVQLQTQKLSFRLVCLNKVHFTCCVSGLALLATPC